MGDAGLILGGPILREISCSWNGHLRRMCDGLSTPCRSDYALDSVWQQAVFDAVHGHLHYSYFAALFPTDVGSTLNAFYRVLLLHLGCWVSRDGRSRLPRESQDHQNHCIGIILRYGFALAAPTAH